MLPLSLVLPHIMMCLMSSGSDFGSTGLALVQSQDRPSSCSVFKANDTAMKINFRMFTIEPQ